MAESPRSFSVSRSNIALPSLKLLSLLSTANYAGGLSFHLRLKLSMAESQRAVSMNPLSYSAWTGKTGPFHWIQSNAALALDLLEECVDLVEAKYIVMPTFDGCSLVPVRETQNADRWLAIGAPRIVASPREILWTSNGEEIYVFSEKPSDEIVGLIESTETVTADRFEALETVLQNEFWEAMSKIAPETYIAQGQYFFMATSKQELFENVMQSKPVIQLPSRGVQDLMRRQQQRLQEVGPESGPEKCLHQNCTRLRVELGVFCAEHHLSMLSQSKDPTMD
jgi:hypothetical protein